MALALPGATEQGHMGRPDFRVRKRIFATLGYPDVAWAMVKLKPEQQEICVAAEPNIFVPANGAWGRGGATILRLELADAPTAASVLRMAWSNLQP